MGDRTDRDLVRAAKGGSVDAAGALFERHWATAWRAAYGVIGRREAADDVAQDAFIRAFAALDRFDERRPFRPWLHRIVVNRALDEVRRERRRTTMPEVDAATWDVHADTDGEGLLALIAVLAPERRAVCVLRYGLDYSPAEIAGILGIPVGTVNSRLARALSDLRAAQVTGGV